MDERIINLSNIMSVDLAIKRELEYRSKLEMSRNQHQFDLKPLVLSQGPEACEENAELTPIIPQKPRQFSSNSQPLIEKPAFSCKTCGLTFASIFHLSSHVESPQHKIIISQMKKSREGMATCNQLWCEMCKCSCTSFVQMKAHLSGSKQNSIGKRKRLE